MFNYAAVLLLTALPSNHPSAVRADELAAAQAWAAAKFQANTIATPRTPGLVVIANHDPVQRNARGGRPLNLAGRQFTRGLYCHADSKVVVRLPEPANSFIATVGIDSNEQTSGGRGSIIFTVAAGDKELFRSKLLREGMPPVSVSVDLGGASELTLSVDNGGDGIACDQADWADARVVLADGAELWLGNLPIFRERPPISQDPPFSFTYGGKPSAQLLPGWRVERTSKTLDEARTQRTVVYTDPDTGLLVRCIAVAYQDFPTIEWTVYLENTGKADTPLIADLQGLDTRVELEGQTCILHHSIGSPCTATDYRPLVTELGVGATKTITTSGGRPTNSDMPYFNLELGADEGLIAVIGWPGQWAARFLRDAGTGLRLIAGQELTHFVLHPGEKIRTPLVVLQFYRGDWIRGQNIWRRWMLAHNVPPAAGRPARSHLAACSSHQFAEMINADEASQILFIDRYLEEKLPLDYWWMDAGWYPNKTGWPNTGTWEVDPKRFPRGLRAISDHAHQRGVRTIVWFEPERVTADTWLSTQHPDWLLGGTLLNLGLPAARRWLTDHVDRLLTEQGIDLYRQDFNMDPLEYWRKADATDRQGITEIRHVEGYLAYWDELRRRHPGMLIDTCASGGRRNDLETLRRAVPLLRSDYILEPVGNQNHTYGIALWIPMFGTGVNQFEPYGFRSCMCPYLNACYDIRRPPISPLTKGGPEGGFPPADYDAVRKLMAEWQQVAPDFLGDFYPLTRFSPDADAWMAWQFDRPEAGLGMIQVFRRHSSPYESARFQLRGLDPAARYRITNLDAPGESKELPGRELMDTGILITLKQCPSSALLRYERVE